VVALAVLVVLVEQAQPVVVGVVEPTGLLVEQHLAI
jgi:hypothetical protein